MKTIVYGLTFHRAHNFGSVLQAYAMSHYIQQFGIVNNIDIDFKFIDYYPPCQKELYAILSKKVNFKTIVKNLIALKYYKSLKCRHKAFDDFIKKYLVLTEQYTSSVSISNNLPIADYYICGGDQIWNVRAADFSWTYLLDFVPMNHIKASYATSLGPKEIDWSRYDHKRYSRLIKDFNFISVREKGSRDNLRAIVNVNPEILPDPTLLLSSEEWSQICSEASLQENNQYILFYCLEPTHRQLSLARTIGKRLGLKVITLRYNNKHDWFNLFDKRYSAGPCDFLSYIKHAAMVLTSSFHGMVFSIIFKKPFYVIDNAHDFRIDDLLSKTALTDRLINEPKVVLDPPRFDESLEFMMNSKRRVNNYFRKVFLSEIIDKYN